MIFGGITDYLFVIVSLLLWIFYRYTTKNFNYWKERGVFYDKPKIVYGSLKDRILFRTSFHEFQLNLYRRFDGYKYAGFFEGRRPTLMVRDPDLIKNITVRDFEHFVDRPSIRIRNSPYTQNMLLTIKGQHWKDVRALLTPTFSSGKLKAMKYLVEQCGEQMGKYLQKETANGSNSTEQEMKDFFGRFTLDVIAICAFGVQCDSLKDPEAEFVKIAAKFNDISIPQRLMILFVLLLVPDLAFLFPISFLNKEATAFLVDVLKKTIDHRLKHKEQKWNDFLQLVIDASEEENGESGKESESNKNENNAKKNTKVLDEVTVIAQALLFLLAGFETSSTLLTYASYELALNEEIQKKLRKEILDVLEKHGGQCTYEALSEMNYLEMVLQESLRKHPPVARVDRVCTQAYTIPGTNVTIDKGLSVSISIMGLHHDPQYYPEPEKFDPNRFSQEGKANRSPYVFLPFGTGPRNCIGMRFAIMSTKICMVHLIKDFYLKPSTKTEIPFKYSKYSMFLKSQNGIWLNVERI